MAELIITLAAGAGTGLTGPVAVPGIYNAYGGPSYSIESMIENDIINLADDPDALDQEIIDALGHGNRLYDLDVDAFRDLMSTDWEVMVDSGMDIALKFNDLWDTSSSTPAIDNLGAILKDVLEIGYVQGEMTIANLANPVESATVHIEDMGTALKTYFHAGMISGVYIDTISNTNRYARQNYKNAQGLYGAEIGTYNPANNLSNNAMFFDPLNIIATSVSTPGVSPLSIIFYNISSQPASYTNWGVNFNPGTINSNSFNAQSVAFNNTDNILYGEGLIFYFNSAAERDAYVAELRADPDLYNPKYNVSPDLINQETGFLTVGNEDSAISPLINFDGMDIINYSDYQDMVDEVTQDKENAPEIYDLFLDPYLFNYGDPVPEEPLPTYAPVRPLEPEQPTIPEKEEITSEDQEKALTYTTPGLTEVFPFCIPFDIWKMLRTLTAEREAPVFNFPLVIESQGINEEVTVDMSIFDTVASICRMLELILFVIGLAVATRKLIGAT